MPLALARKAAAGGTLGAQAEGLEKLVGTKEIASVLVNGVAGAITAESMTPGAEMLPVLLSLNQFF